MNENMETRSIILNNIETRQEEDNYIIEGYINKYNSRSQFMGFFEEVEKGAFDRSLSTRDFIPALYNHDSSKILGSTRSKSLMLESDEIGLKYSLRINKNISYANDVFELVKSGDVEGCSFGFICTKDEWTTLEDGTSLRTIKEVDLLEVTITPFPAYLDSNASCRSYDKYLNTKENELTKRKLQIELELL